VVLPTSTRSTFWTGVTRDRSSEDSRYPDLGGVGGVSLLRDHMLVARPAASTCTRAMSGLWPCIVLCRHGWLLAIVDSKPMLERLFSRMTAPSSKSKRSPYTIHTCQTNHVTRAMQPPCRGYPCSFAVQVVYRSSHYKYFKGWALIQSLSLVCLLRVQQGY
jgi:hypothetical protein